MVPPPPVSWTTQASTPQAGAPALYGVIDYERLLSPSHAPAVLKLGAGLLTGVLLYGYLFMPGRPRHAPHAALVIAA
jgi:hypothetical protein